MELLLQFIMGGGGINSRTIGGSASQLWQSSGEVGWGPHFLSVFPVQTLLIPAATSKKEICLRVETRHSPGLNIFQRQTPKTTTDMPG